MPHGPATPQAGLLERADDLATLTSALRDAARGHGGLVLLSGEAGVGKTSLVRELAAASAGAAAARVLVGWCEPLTSPRPLAPLLDVLPGLGRRVGQTFARVRDGAPTAELFDSVVRELAAGPGCSLLVFEDVHWADEATLDLIRFLARRLVTAPALLVVTYRDGEIGRTHPLTVLLGDLAPLPGITRVGLARLSAEAVARLAVGHDVDAARLHEVTGGNPFFVVEVLAAAPGGGLPATVRAAIRGRLARLSPAGSALVEALAVLGRPAEAALVTALVEDAEAGLRSALEHGLLTAATSTVAFCHELARMAVLDTVPAFRRVELHAGVLALLLRGEVAEDELALVVEHAEQAGDATAVATYAPLAGRRATALGAHREATTHYARALRSVDQLAEADQLDLLQRAHRAFHLSHELTAAADCGRQLVALQRAQGDRLAAGETLHALAHTLWASGRTGQARLASGEAVRLLEQLAPSAELARAYAHAIELSFLTQDLGRAGAPAAGYPARALDLARRLELPDVEAWVRFFQTAGRLRRTDDGWDELRALRDRAVREGWLEHIPRLTLTPAGLAALRHDPVRAVPMLDEAARLLANRDMSGFVLFLRGCRSYALLQVGDWAGAAAEATAVRLDPRGTPPTYLAPLAVLGLLRARRGEPGVWPVLDEAMGLIEEPDLLRLCVVHEARAEAAWLAGDHGRAAEEARRGLLGAGPAADPWQAGPLACWLHRAGEAPPPLPVAEPYARELAGDWAGAADAYEARGLPYEAALARLGGDADAARAALALFTRLGAEAAAAVARTRLRALGERRHTRPPWDSTRRNPYGLTGRQLEVHALLVEGLTNAQIAARLVLSPNTVNHHVAAILTKLDVPNRVEAARKLG